MNRLTLSAMAVLAALSSVSMAHAQANPHAGMSMQDHAAMQPVPAANGVSTTPADNAMLSSAPTAFSAIFPMAMTLKSLSLTGPTSQPIDVTIPSSTAPGTTVSVTLPALSPGSYAAAWSATGADGHQMSGVVRFMVH